LVSSKHFDREYYQRYYHRADTAIMTRDMQRNEVAFVIAFCRHIGVEVERFSDVGAGAGWWAREFSRQYRRCKKIETFDSSTDACALYGHQNVPLQKLKRPRADLVVCRDVLRYISDSDIDIAIARLADKCRGVLYLQVMTSDDDIDEDASDMAGWFRTSGWYRRALKRLEFRDCGMGLFVSHRFKDFDPFALETR
jgi:hypothetical protein